MLCRVPGQNTCQLEWSAATSNGIEVLIAIPCSPLPLRLMPDSSPDSQLTPVQSQGSRTPSSAQSPGLAPRLSPRPPLKLLAKPSRSPLVSPAPPRGQTGVVSPSVRSCCIQSLALRTPRAKDRNKAQAAESSKDMQCRDAMLEVTARQLHLLHSGANTDEVSRYLLTSWWHCGALRRSRDLRRLRKHAQHGQVGEPPT